MTECSGDSLQAHTSFNGRACGEVQTDDCLATVDTSPQLISKQLGVSSLRLSQERCSLGARYRETPETKHSSGLGSPRKCVRDAPGRLRHCDSACAVKLVGSVGAVVTTPSRSPQAASSPSPPLTGNNRSCLPGYTIPADVLLTFRKACRWRAEAGASRSPKNRDCSRQAFAVSAGLRHCALLSFSGERGTALNSVEESRTAVTERQTALAGEPSHVVTMSEERTPA